MGIAFHFTFPVSLLCYGALVRTPQQTIEATVSTPEGRARLAHSIATDAPPQSPEISRPIVEEGDDHLLRSPLWLALFVSGVGTLVWGLLLLIAR